MKKATEGIKLDDKKVGIFKKKFGAVRIVRFLGGKLIPYFTFFSFLSMT